VAEHSFFVAYYALMIAKWCDIQQTARLCPLDYKKLLTRGLLHDIDEATTGDIPRTFKYSNAKLKQLLNTVAEHGVENLADRLWPSSPVSLAISEEWKTAKDDSLEGRILEFADFLSVLSFLYEEIRASNFIMREHISAMREYYDRFKHPGYDFLRPLIKEAGTILFEEILADETK